MSVNFEDVGINMVGMTTFEKSEFVDQETIPV